MKSRRYKESSPARWRLLFLVPVFLLVIVGVAVLIWWQYHKTTPAYTLAILVHAAQRNDKDGLDEVFDADQVFESLALEVAQNKGVDLPDWLRSGMRSVSPSVTETIKPIIREGIRRRINELSAEADGKPFIVTALGVLLKANITEEGNKATATITNRDQTLELRMQRSDRQWKVVSVKDDALTARIVEEIRKELPGRLPPAELTNPLDGILPTRIP